MNIEIHVREARRLSVLHASKLQQRAQTYQAQTDIQIQSDLVECLQGIAHCFNLLLHNQERLTTGSSSNNDLLVQDALWEIPLKFRSAPGHRAVFELVAAFTVNGELWDQSTMKKVPVCETVLTLTSPVMTAKTSSARYT